MLLGDKPVDLRPEKSAARLGIEDVNGVKEGFLWDPDEETVVGSGGLVMFLFLDGGCCGSWWDGGGWGYCGFGRV